MMNNMSNPYQMYPPYMNQYQAMNAPHYEVIKVSNIESARSFQIGPNSSALLLDETSPLVYLVSTDGTGYKTVTPFQITPYQQEPQVDVNSLVTRIEALEKQIGAKQNEPNSSDA